MDISVKVNQLLGLPVVEAMKTLDDLPDDIYISVKQQARGRVWCCFSDENGIYSKNIKPHGQVLCAKEELNEGSVVYRIAGHTQIDTGYGPLLYDVLIEYCTRLGGGLVSDRKSMTPAAINLWQKYYHRHDVGKERLPTDVSPMSDLSPQLSGYDFLYYIYTKSPRLILSRKCLT
jgi:hypothetical protein